MEVSIALAMAANNQIKQDLAEQHKQLRKKKVQVVQASCHLHPCLWLWNLDPACWLREKDPDIGDKVPEETFPRFLLGAQVQRVRAEQDQLPCGTIGTSSGNCKETEIRMVPTCHALGQPLQSHSSGHLAALATTWSPDEMLDEQR